MIHIPGRRHARFPPVPQPMEPPIATKRNTYAKRQREQDKRQRADMKRIKREQRKVAPPPTELPDMRDPAASDTADS